jgi:hypothetical protein
VTDWTQIEVALPIGRRMVAIARWKGKSSYGKLMPGSVESVKKSGVSSRNICECELIVQK